MLLGHTNGDITSHYLAAELEELAARSVGEDEAALQRAHLRMLPFPIDDGADACTDAVLQDLVPTLVLILLMPVPVMVVLLMVPEDHQMTGLDSY